MEQSKREQNPLSGRGAGLHIVKPHCEDLVAFDEEVSVESAGEPIARNNRAKTTQNKAVALLVDESRPGKGKRDCLTSARVHVVDYFGDWDLHRSIGTGS
jgi:hypothetical protein